MTTELNTTNGSLESQRRGLVKDLKGVAADAHDLMKEVVNATTDEFSATTASIETKLGNAKGRVDDARLVVIDTIRDSAGATQHYVKEHPWAAVGAGALFGLAIGFLLGRR